LLYNAPSRVSIGVLFCLGIDNFSNALYKKIIRSFDHQITNEKFSVKRFISLNIRCHTTLTSDHYTNYINLDGKLPDDRERLLWEIDRALERDESEFRPFFIGTE